MGYKEKNSEQMETTKYCLEKKHGMTVVWKWEQILESIGLDLCTLSQGPTAKRNMLYFHMLYLVLKDSLQKYTISETSVPVQIEKPDQ